MAGASLDELWKLSRVKCIKNNSQAIKTKIFQHFAYNFIWMSEKKRVLRKGRSKKSDSDSEESLFVPTKKHDQYQRWSDSEHAKYAAYLEEHLEDFVI